MTTSAGDVATIKRSTGDQESTARSGCILSCIWRCGHNDPRGEIPPRRCSLRLVMLIGGPRDGETKLWPPSSRWLFPYQGEYVLDFTGVTASWSPCE